MKILIVGGGIGGLALGAFLRESEIEYEIAEKCPDWGMQGFLISMWDSGRDILKKLGLAEAFDKAGTRISRYSFRDGSGRVMREYDFSHFFVNYGSAVTVLKRADLHAWLLQKADPSRVRMNAAVVAIVQDQNSATATFSDGSSGQYDLIVGADGIHSAVRAALFGKDIERYENWRIWYAWVDSAFSTPGTIAEYVAPREMAVVFSGDGKTMVWMFAPADHAVRDEVKGRAERLREIFKDETALMPSALREVRDEDILVSDLVSLKLSRWSRGRVVLLGDAAHSFGPHAGIGGGMALEDAYTLAGELMQVGVSYPLSAALKTYERKRKERVGLAEDLSRKMRFFTLMKSKLLRRIANRAVRFVPERLLTKDLEALLAQEI